MSYDNQRALALVRLLALAKQLGAVEQVHMYDGSLLSVAGSTGTGRFRLTLALESDG